MNNNIDLKESLLNWAFNHNAISNFNNFIHDINNNSGLSDAVKKVFSVIDEIVLNKEQSQFIKNLNSGETVYRARIIDPSDYQKTDKGIGKTTDNKLIGYNEDNSREPILGISSEGRNNIQGASYLYVASTPATACMEVKSSFGQSISLATFEVADTLSIIDFSSEKAFEQNYKKLYNMSLGTFFTKLMSYFTIPVHNVYHATQIISDYLRKTGIDGIKYRSFFVPNGENYTIFNCHPKKFKFMGSKVLIHKYANHSFWDFNEEVSIMSDRENLDIEYDKKIADKQRNDLLKDFQRIE